MRWLSIALKKVGVTARGMTLEVLGEQWIVDLTKVRNLQCCGFVERCLVTLGLRIARLQLDSEYCTTAVDRWSLCSAATLIRLRESKFALAVSVINYLQQSLPAYPKHARNRSLLCTRPMNFIKFFYMLSTTRTHCCILFKEDRTFGFHSEQKNHDHVNLVHRVLLLKSTK